MEVKVQQVVVKDYVTKSKLPASDFVINPYVGCPHACKYCYACFMKRFTKHEQPWGQFIDVKRCPNKIDKKKLENKTIFLSSVTDCYNEFERTYEITRNILSQLYDVDCEIHISTKSSLVLRDMDILKKCKRLKVAVSINTLDEDFKNDMDHASSIDDRLKTLQQLKRNGIYTVLFMSPIFPYITDFKKIIDTSKADVDEYWFEDLNLRGAYKQEIMRYIEGKYPNLLPLYQEIYVKNSREFWDECLLQIKSYCDEQAITYVIFFDHQKMVKQKANK